MSSNIAISLKNIEKVYKLYKTSSERLKESFHPFRKKYHTEFFALKNFNLDIRRGETVGIIGKNGSGKSTLLKVLAGVLTPSRGSVIVNGKVSALLELGAGFNPEMTGVENVFFHGMLLGYTREEMREKLPSILSFADLGEFVFQPVKTYSSGMFVRLAFAVSVSVDPDILIVDEALAVGDMAFQKKCLDKIDFFKKQGKTILFCGHDMHMMNSLCDRVVWIRNGEVGGLGESADVISEYVTWMAQAQGSSSEEIVAKKAKVGPNYFVRNSEIVEINSVRSFDCKGQESNFFMEGQDIYFQIEYHAKAPIENPNYSYILFNERKVPVAIGKKSFERCVSDVVNGKVIVNFCLKEVSLNRGIYTLGFSVWDKFNKVAFANNITCEFQVKTLKVTFGPTEEKCVFFPKTSWNVF